MVKKKQELGHNTILKLALSFSVFLLRLKFGNLMLVWRVNSFFNTKTFF